MSLAARARAIAGTSAPDRARRTWSQARLFVGVVVGMWAVMFWFLFLSGRVYLCLSTRTAWVVPVGDLSMK